MRCSERSFVVFAHNNVPVKSLTTHGRSVLRNLASITQRCSVSVRPVVHISWPSQQCPRLLHPQTAALPLEPVHAFCHCRYQIGDCECVKALWLCVILARSVCILSCTAHLVALDSSRTASSVVTLRDCLLLACLILIPTSAAPHRTEFELCIHDHGPHLRLCRRPDLPQAVPHFRSHWFDRRREQSRHVCLKRGMGCHWHVNGAVLRIFGLSPALIPPAVQQSASGSESLPLLRCSLHPVH